MGIFCDKIGVLRSGKPMTNKNPTLSDVARASGVHFSTVSRVMNPATRQMVSAEVATRVLANCQTPVLLVR